MTSEQKTRTQQELPLKSHAEEHQKRNQKAYWKANLVILSKLLSVWFFVSFICGLILAPQLNAFTFPGTDFPLGFWFAQQGSIYIFVILIFVYIKLMDRLDAEYAVNEKEN